jgi:hypothetical protein
MLAVHCSAAEASEARPLVVSGYDGLKKESDTSIIADNNARDDLTDAMDRLELLYESCQDQSSAARWKAKSSGFEGPTTPGRFALAHPGANCPPGRSMARQGIGVGTSQQRSHFAARPGDKVSSADGIWFGWEYWLRDYAINFNGLLGEETRNSVAYAVCYVQVTTPRKGLVLKVGLTTRHESI